MSKTAAKHISGRIRIAESGIFIALATVLSIMLKYPFPYGGSITLCSMLPIMVLGLRYGTGWGFLCGLAYGVIQALVGFEAFSWVTGAWQVIAVLALDFLLAFSVIGLAGMYKKIIKNPIASAVTGAVTVCILRFLCHLVIGAVLWAGMVEEGGWNYELSQSLPWIYSAAYNGIYMSIECVSTALVIGIMVKFLDFDKERPWAR